MASTTIFTKLKLAQVNGTPINYASDTLVMLLVVAGSAAPVTTKTGSQYISDVTGSNAEVTGTGYARQTLTSVTVAYDGTATNQVDFSHAMITFAQNAAGFTNGRYCVVAKSTGTDSTSQVVYVYDPGTTLSAQTGDVVLSSPTGGEIQWL
jgi:hypothetical protein